MAEVLPIETPGLGDRSYLVHDGSTALVIDPLDSQTIYAGTTRDGVFKSTNGGRDWRPKNQGLVSLAIRSLLTDETMPSVLYAGTLANSVWVSTDAGETWH